jgi:hypothetical protein
VLFERHAMASPSTNPESLASLGDFYLLVGTTYQTQASISEPLASLIFHDQDGDAVVFAGGAEGLEEDADPANVSALLATGRASIYVHGLEMAFDSGDASPFNTPSQVLETTSNATSSDAIAQVIQTTGSETNGVLELYETNVSSIATADWNSPWGNYDWQAELTQTGWVPAEATMNLNWGPTGLTTQAEQDALALAQAAQEAGIKTVLPIISPQGLEAGNFATLASDANDRALALQLGGLVIDMPSNYFLDNPGGTYQATAISEIKWAVANDLVVAVLLSPYSETTTGIPQFEYDSTFLSASQQVESILAAAGALPTQWMIENYAPLDGDANPVTGSDPNSINSVATWFAENAPTAPEPSWFIGETSVSNTPQEATATISVTRGIAIVASSVVGWLPTDVSSTVEYTLVGSPATVQAALQAVQVTGAGADGGTGKLTVTITDADGNATSTNVAITVDPTAPWNVTTNVTGAVGESVPFSVSGDAGANAEVTLLDGSQVIGTTTADAAGSWNLPSVLLDTVGVHTLSATAEFDGLTSGESQDISVDVSSPVTPIPSVTGAGSLGATQDSASSGATESPAPASGGSNSPALTPEASDSPGPSPGTAEDPDNNVAAPVVSDLTVDVTSPPPPAYIQLSSNVYVVGADASETATINDAGDQGQVIVFGGNSNLDFTGGDACLVFNGSNQNGAVTIWSEGGDQVWAGDAPIDYKDGGSSVIILGATPSETTTVSVADGTSLGSDEIAVWGQTGVTDTVNHLADGSATVFGGLANLCFSGNNSFIVANGSDQGSVTVYSNGNNVIWGPSSELLYYEGGGSDTIYAGAGLTDIHGTQAAEGGTTTLIATGSSGEVSVSGGAKNEILLLGRGPADIQAGSGNMTLTGGAGQSTIDLSAAGHATLDLSGTEVGATDIFGFNPSTGSVTISDVTYASQQGPDFIVTCSDGSSIIFHDVSSTQGIVLTGS